MGYQTNLTWMKNLAEFSENQKKVLLALSHDTYRWRTRERIIAVTGLSPKDVDGTLSELIEKGTVRVSRSKTKNIIFGLVERVHR